MTELEECNLALRAVTAEAAELRAEVAQLNETLEFARSMTPFEGRPCPLCRYEGGVFARACSLHAEIERLTAEVERVRPVVDAALWSELDARCDRPGTYCDDEDRHRAECPLSIARDRLVEAARDLRASKPQAVGRVLIERAIEVAVDAALGEVARQVGSLGHVLREARHGGLAAGRMFHTKPSTFDEDEQAAGREHVERVVREIALQEIMRGGFPNPIAALRTVSLAIAGRVADRLSVPVLSEKERGIAAAHLGWLRTTTTGDVQVGLKSLLDRLIAAGKP